MSCIECGNKSFLDVNRYKAGDDFHAICNDCIKHYTSMCINCCGLLGSWYKTEEKKVCDKCIEKSKVASKYNKPPLGIMPRDIHIHGRIVDLLEELLRQVGVRDINIKKCFEYHEELHFKFLELSELFERKES